MGGEDDGDNDDADFFSRGSRKLSQRVQNVQACERDARARQMLLSQRMRQFRMPVMETIPARDIADVTASTMETEEQPVAVELDMSTANVGANPSKRGASPMATHINKPVHRTAKQPRQSTTIDMEGDMIEILDSDEDRDEDEDEDEDGDDTIQITSEHHSAGSSAGSKLHGSSGVDVLNSISSGSYRFVAEDGLHVRKPSQTAPHGAGLESLFSEPERDRGIGRGHGRQPDTYPPLSVGGFPSGTTDAGPEDARRVSLFVIPRLSDQDMIDGELRQLSFIIFAVRTDDCVSLGASVRLCDFDVSLSPI